MYRAVIKLAKPAWTAAE